MAEVSQIDLDLKFKASATVSTDTGVKTSTTTAPKSSPTPTYVQPDVTYKPIVSKKYASPSQADFTIAFGTVFRKNPRIFVMNLKSTESKRAVDNELVAMGYGRNAGLTVYNSKIDKAVEDWFRTHPDDKIIVWTTAMGLKGQVDKETIQKVKTPTPPSNCQIAAQENLVLIAKLIKIREATEKVRKQLLIDPLNVKLKKDLDIGLFFLRKGSILLENYLKKLTICGLPKNQQDAMKEGIAKIKKTISDCNKAIMAGSNCNTVVKRGQTARRNIRNLIDVISEATIRYKNTKSNAAKQNLTRLINAINKEPFKKLRDDCKRCGSNQLADRINRDINFLTKTVNNSKKVLQDIQGKTVIVKTKEVFPTPALEPKVEISPFTPYEPEVALEPIPAPILAPEQVILKERKRNISIIAAASVTVPIIISIV